MVVWQDIPWKKVQRHVFRLQKRMYRAVQREDVRTVHKLQNLLSKSWYARLLAVRRVTQDTRGKHTAGLDGGEILNTAPTITARSRAASPQQSHPASTHLDTQTREP